MPMITPPELHGLLAIAREEGLDMKPVLLRVLTDLYVSAPHHSSDEIIQFREIAGQMIRMWTSPPPSSSPASWPPIPIPPSNSPAR